MVYVDKPSIAWQDNGEAVNMRSHAFCSTGSLRLPSVPSVISTMLRSDESAATENDVAPTLVSEISSQAMCRTQRLRAFFDMYYPSLKDGVRPTGWLLRIAAELPADSTPAFRFATDALCLSSMGCAQQDAGLKRASRVAYGKLVQYLQSALQQPQRSWESVSHRTVTLSILILALLNDDDADTVPGRSPRSWITHWDAAQQFVAVRGPSYFDMRDPFTNAMLKGLVTGSVYLGIARRKTLECDGTDWTKSRSWDQCRSMRKLLARRLLHVTITIPGVLETTDSLLAKRPRLANDDSIRALLAKIARIQRILQEDLEATREREFQRYVAANDQQAFKVEIEEHCFISTSTTAIDQLCFSSSDNEALQSCQLYVRSVFYLLILTCTTLYILHRRPHLSLYPDVPAQDVLEQQSHELAIELCRTVWQNSKTRSLAITQWIDKYLELAQAVFEEQRSLSMLGWCQACRIACEVRFERLSRVHPPTLCRIGDLPPGIAEIGRYRSQGAKAYATKKPTCPMSDARAEIVTD